MQDISSLSCSVPNTEFLACVFLGLYMLSLNLSSESQAQWHTLVNPAHKEAEEEEHKFEGSLRNSAN